jgi:ribosomal protein S21
MLGKWWIDMFNQAMNPKPRKARTYFHKPGARRKARKAQKASRRRNRAD